jgi:glycosyltransferase involved in cell wall biosynthesis
VVVVDDHSTDDSAELAAAGAKVVRLTEVESGGLNAARNAGIRAASGDLVAFTDDNCEPEPTWLRELIEPMLDPTVDGVAGRTVPASDRDLVLRYLARRNPLAPLRRNGTEPSRVAGGAAQGRGARERAAQEGQSRRRQSRRVRPLRKAVPPVREARRGADVDHRPL